MFRQSPTGQCEEADSGSSGVLWTVLGRTVNHFSVGFHLHCVELYNGFIGRRKEDCSRKFNIILTSSHFAPSFLELPVILIPFILPVI